MVIIETPTFTRLIQEVMADEQIRMLYAYRKAEQEDLTAEELAVVREIVARWSDG